MITGKQRPSRIRSHRTGRAVLAGRRLRAALRQPVGAAASGPALGWPDGWRCWHARRRPRTPSSPGQPGACRPGRRRSAHHREFASDAIGGRRESERELAVGGRSRFRFADWDRSVRSSVRRPGCWLPSRSLRRWWRRSWWPKARTAEQRSGCRGCQPRVLRGHQRRRARCCPRACTVHQVGASCLQVLLVSLHPETRRDPF